MISTFCCRRTGFLEFFENPNRKSSERWLWPFVIYGYSSGGLLHGCRFATCVVCHVLGANRIEEMSYQSHILSAAARSLIQDSRELREISHALIQENGDLREFLQENMLNTLGRWEDWQDRAPELPD